MPSPQSPPEPARAARRLLLGAALLTACGGAAGDAPTPDALPVFALSEPTLEIGVIEGDPNYTFASIASAVRLDDGSIVVSDPGNTRISVFAADGSFLRSWGSRGEGPGEFRSLSRLYPLGADSIMAADGATDRLSVFDHDGELARQVDALTISRDSTFRLDSWLYGRFWIDGALTAEARALVKAALDRVPPPRLGQGFRRGVVSRAGDVWIREPAPAGGDAAVTWTRLGEDGSPAALARMPARFTPLDIRGDRLVGRWIGTADVEFVRSYDLVATGETAPAPEWMRRDPAAAPAVAPLDEEAFYQLMRQAIIQMASHQEIHYSDHYTYTTALDSLDLEIPEGLVVTFTEAHTRGWAAVFTHPGGDRMCGLGYGAVVPPGWEPGAIDCGPASTPPTPGR